MSPATHSRRKHVRTVLSQLRRLSRGESVGGLTANEVGSPDQLRALRRRLIRGLWRS